MIGQVLGEGGRGKQQQHKSEESAHRDSGPA
jgi:hypothetical protein